MPSITLPRTPAAVAALDLARSIEPSYLFNHSVRSYLFAREIARESDMHAGVDYNDEQLFLACVLHDTGLTKDAEGDQRFEVEGADFARRFVLSQGVDEPSAWVVWQAIALHTSDGIAERMGPEIALTRAGIGVDFGRRAEVISNTLADEIHASWPRLDMARSLADDIVACATARPSKANPYTLTEGVLHERNGPSGVSRIELAALQGRWGS